MNANELALQYLSQKRVMQLATHADGSMWSCNVHFYTDDNMNFYWMSAESRKHSQQIIESGHASVAVLIHEDTPAERYVIGIQMSGSAEQLVHVGDAIQQAYFKKIGTPPALQADIASGKIPNKFYKFTPSEAILFDTKNFPDEPRQIIR